MSKRYLMVGASITCESEVDAARAVEALSRVTVGLAMEGLSVSVNVVPIDEDDES